MTRTRTPFSAKIEKKRAEFMNLWCEGKTLVEIGKLYGETPQNVGYHIGQVMEGWRSHSEVKAEQWLNRELQKCMYGESKAWELYNIAMEAYEKSIGTIETVTESGKARNNKGEKPRKKIELDSTTTEIQIKREVSIGDSQFLKTALKAQEEAREWHVQRCKLLGIESPKTQIEIGGDVNINTARESVISELTRLASIQGARKNTQQARQ